MFGVFLTFIRVVYGTMINMSVPITPAFSVHLLVYQISGDVT